MVDQSPKEKNIRLKSILLLDVVKDKKEFPLTYLLHIITVNNIPQNPSNIKNKFKFGSRIDI